MTIRLIIILHSALANAPVSYSPFSTCNTLCSFTTHRLSFSLSHHFYISLCSFFGLTLTHWNIITGPAVHFRRCRFEFESRVLSFFCPNVFCVRVSGRVLIKFWASELRRMAGHLIQHHYLPHQHHQLRLQRHHQQQQQHRRQQQQQPLILITGTTMWTLPRESFLQT